MESLSPKGYSPPETRPPLATYAALSTLFASGYLALLIASRRGRLELPEEVDFKDLVILGAATHKLSRLISKDKVMSFARAPFQRRERDAATGEVTEEPRGTGSQRAIGELLGCPYCLGLWISAGLFIGLAIAPRETRFATSTLTALSLSDFLQLAYSAGHEAA
jgi:Protein of unknown function (DUF1360)